MKNENGFPALLDRFFTQRLIAQRRVSSHTIASYRDTFRLLLQFVEKRLHKPPSGLALTDLDTSLIGAFLDELEKDRGNGARSRNLRLTAIRCFYRYAADDEPTQPRNSTPFCLPPTLAPGPDAGITPSCWLPFRLACGFLK